MWTHENYIHVVIVISITSYHTFSSASSRDMAMHLTGKNKEEIKDWFKSW